MLLLLLKAFAGIFLVTGFAYGDEHVCDKHGVLLYEEIGCKPIKEKPDDLCPSRFDCTEVQKNGEHCTFMGRKLRNRESVPGELFDGLCEGGCFCNVLPALSGGVFLTSFTCAVFDCPEFLGGSRLDKDCYRTYSLDRCCSSGQICPPFDNATKCEVDGETIKEGLKFQSKRTCQACVCKKGFNGKLEDPFCKRVTCATELRNPDVIRQNCAPLYDTENGTPNDALCCPYFFVCPSKSDVIAPAESQDSNGKVCKYGEKEVKSGQILRTNANHYGRNYKVKCECKLPPLLTCVVESSERI